MGNEQYLVSKDQIRAMVHEVLKEDKELQEKIDMFKKMSTVKKKEEKDKKKTAKRFTPPTVEEVRAYCLERGNAVDPERFVDFYASKGWKVGNQGMKDWKACVRTWEKRSNKVGANGVKISENHDDTLDGII